MEIKTIAVIIPKVIHLGSFLGGVSVFASPVSSLSSIFSSTKRLSRVSAAPRGTVSMEEKEAATKPMEKMRTSEQQC